MPGSEKLRSRPGRRSAGGDSPALVYVSWGGTGRAASLREAMRRATSEQRALVYLAVLDDRTFADLDGAMLRLVADELEWLLDAQIELTRTQLGADELAVTVMVRAGDVVELVGEVVAGTGPTEVLIGAPVPLAGHDSVQAIIDLIEAGTSSKATLVLPQDRAPDA